MGLANPLFFFVVFFCSFQPDISNTTKFIIFLDILIGPSQEASFSDRA